MQLKYGTNKINPKQTLSTARKQVNTQTHGSDWVEQNAITSTAGRSQTFIASVAARVQSWL